MSLPFRIELKFTHGWVSLYLQASQPEFPEWSNKAVYRPSRTERRLMEESGIEPPVVLIKEPPKYGVREERSDVGS